MVPVPAPVSRCFLFAAVGLMLVGCFNTSKTTKVSPGATSPQPEYTCQPRGDFCRINSDCCSRWCVNGTCVSQ
jgi:hypothetical protein